ncbi:putative reverse transcriptase domain-containing protein [Tanacetum coccineum]
MNATPHILQPQINHSSVLPSQQYQSHMDHQTSYVPQNAYHSPQVSTQPMTEFPQLDSGLAVPVFTQGDDPIACLNKAMAFLLAVAASRFPSTNNQLRTSSNPRNQATIIDGRVTVQQVQGRQGQSYVGTSYKGNATSLGGEQYMRADKGLKTLETSYKRTGKDKGKNKLAYAPKPKIPPPPKREHPAKDSVCHHCKEVGHWKRNCPSYQAELKKRKSCGTHICNSHHGRRSMLFSLFKVVRLLHHEVEGRVEGLVEEVEVGVFAGQVIFQQLQDLLPTIIAQVGNHASNIQGDVRGVNVGNGRNGCSYKEFMACNPKDYDGKGGAIVYTRWIEKMESVQDMSGCGANQKVKYTASSFIGKALTWWNTQVQTRGREAAVGMTWEDFKVLMSKEFCPNNEMQKLETEFWCHAMVGADHVVYTDHFHELARLVPHLVTLKNKRIERYIYGLAPQIYAMVATTEPTTIQSVMLKAGMLTDEAIRNGSLKKNTKKRGNVGELSRNENVRDDTKKKGKKSRDCRAFVTNHYHVRMSTRGLQGGARMVTLVKARKPRPTAEGRVLRWWLLITTRQSRPSSGNNGNQAHRGAFIMGAEEARQAPNIMTADYSFVSTTFIPLLDIEPSDLGFSYEIEISSEQLVEINKVIRGFKLEIEGHTFDIDLIPFKHGSFDVIIRMDWLSWHKAEIICHEKVVRIPLPYGEILRVLGENPEEKVRHLMSAKTEERKLRDIVVVRNFPKVFLDDLSGLPPSREFKFRIDLILGEMSVVKSPYRLASSEMEELSSQLREL